MIRKKGQTTIDINENTHWNNDKYVDGGLAFFTDHSYKSTLSLGHDFYNLVNIYGHLGFVTFFSVSIIILQDAVGGRSFGKRVMNISILHKDTYQRCGLLRTIFRSTVLYFLLLSFFINIIAIEYLIITVILYLLSDLILLNSQPNRRTIGDWITNSIVIHKPDLISENFRTLALVRSQTHQMK